MCVDLYLNKGGRQATEISYQESDGPAFAATRQEYCLLLRANKLNEILQRKNSTFPLFLKVPSSKNVKQLIQFQMFVYSL